MKKFKTLLKETSKAHWHHVTVHVDDAHLDHFRDLPSKIHPYEKKWMKGVGDHAGSNACHVSYSNSKHHAKSGGGPTKKLNKGASGPLRQDNMIHISHHNKQHLHDTVTQAQGIASYNPDNKAPHSTSGLDIATYHGGHSLHSAMKAHSLDGKHGEAVKNLDQHYTDHGDIGRQVGEKKVPSGYSWGTRGRHLNARIPAPGTEDAGWRSKRH